MTASLRDVVRPSRPLLRILAFPHAGGTATYYQAWRDHLPEGVGLTAVQYPGRQDRLAEPCIDDMRRMVDAVVADVKAAGITEPVVLFGHSMGAAVAYECVPHMANATVLLVVSAKEGPGRTRGGTVHQRPDDGIVDALTQLGQDTSALRMPELRDLLMPSIRADHRLIETYRPSRQQIPVPLLALGGSRDPEVSRADLEDWGDYARGGFAVQIFEGGHFYVDEQAPAVLRAILAVV